jgi:peptide/nickel transport system substrate-binding protein
VIELEETLQADLRRVGIEMKIRLVDFNQLLALLNGPPKGWDATGIAISAQPYPTGEGEFATGAYENSGGYSNPEMDRLISASIAQPGIEPLYDYETFASVQQPVIFTPRERPVILVSDRLHGMRDFINPAAMFSPDKLYCTVPAEALR